MSGIELPIGYRQYEYIEPHEAGAYIDTGYLVKDTDTLELVTYQKPNVYELINGNSSGNNRLQLNIESISGIRYYTAVTSNVNTSKILIDSQDNDKIIKLILSHNKFKIETDERTQEIDLVGDTVTQTSSFWLFKWNGSSFTSKNRLYGFKVLDDNNNVVKNFVPAKRESDNKFGLFETVSGTWFGNLGSSYFDGFGEIVPEYVSYIEKDNDIYNIKDTVARKAIEALEARVSALET